MIYRHEKRRILHDRISYIKLQRYTPAFQLVMKIEMVARVIVLSIKKPF